MLLLVRPSFQFCLSEGTGLTASVNIVRSSVYWKNTCYYTMLLKLIEIYVILSLFIDFMFEICAGMSLAITPHAYNTWVQPVAV